MKKTDRFDALKRSVLALDEAQNAGKPVQIGYARETALIEGLKALANACNRKIQYTRIDSLGEMSFVIDAGFNGADKPSGYGIELAAWLGTIPRRTGTEPTSGGVLPENSWCRLNHFDAERLVRAAAAQPERTIYVPSLLNPDQSQATCSAPFFTFDPKWVADTSTSCRPIYKIEPGQPAVLAVDEMLAHADTMSEKLFNYICALDRTPEVEALMQAAPWAEDHSDQSPSPSI